MSFVYVGQVSLYVYLLPVLQITNDGYVPMCYRFSLAKGLIYFSVPFICALPKRVLFACKVFLHSPLHTCWLVLCCVMLLSISCVKQLC